MSNSIGKFDLSNRLKFGVGKGVTIKKISQSIAGALFAATAMLAAYNIWVLHNSETLSPRVLSETDGADDLADSSPYYTHTVRAQETIFTISADYGVSWSAVVALNNLQPPYYLKPGVTLKIPKH